MANMLRPSQGLFEKKEDTHNQIRHYLHLFWRMKKRLLAAGVGVFIASMILLIKIVARQPELQATALVSVQNSADVAAIKDVSGMMEAQSDLITSRTFLKDIVTVLSLQLSLKKFDRGAIFDSVRAGPSARAGAYSFIIDRKKGDRYSITFDPDAKAVFSLQSLKDQFHPEAIFWAKLSGLAGIDLDGIHGVFSKAFLSAPFDFSFRILDLPDAVEKLYNAITVKEMDARSDMSNIALSVQGRDYQLAATIANRIADAFVEKNMAFKRQRTHGVLSSLDKQIETASQDLAAAEKQLRDFRVANPGAGLAENAKAQMSGLSQLEQGVSAARKSLEDAYALQGRYAAASPENGQMVIAEIIAFLAARNVGAAPVYQSELTKLTGEQAELARTYGADHPIRKENDQKIENLKKDILNSLQTYITSAQNAMSGKTAQVQSLASELHNLPAAEMQLAQLTRRQQIAADIYSTVLSRYNQAKAADAGEIAETFVMDYAVPPLPPPLNLPKMFGLVLFIDLLLLVTPVVMWNSISRKALTEYEFTRKTGTYLLESIPRSGGLKRSMTAGVIKEAGGAPLGGPDDENDMVHEIFRSLRQKVLFKLNDNPGKSIVVTGMDPSSGKSTIAVNLACSIARQDIATLIIDADLRCGELYRAFGRKRKPGLSEFLRAETPPSSDPASLLLQQTSIPALSFISSGEPEQVSSELLASDRFLQLKRELARRFTMIIIDAPPLGAIVDAAVIDPSASAYIIVVRAGATDVFDLTKKISEFPGIERNVLGYVLNFASLDGKLKYYKYARYYRHAAKSKHRVTA